MILANGFNWQRYRVLFADGTESATSTTATSNPRRAARRLAKAAAGR